MYHIVIDYSLAMKNSFEVLYHKEKLMSKLHPLGTYNSIDVIDTIVQMY